MLLLSLLLVAPIFFREAIIDHSYNDEELTQQQKNNTFPNVVFRHPFNFPYVNTKLSTSNERNKILIKFI